MLMDNTETLHPDAELIKSLGGPSTLAETLGFDKAAGGAQRVQNWMKRGIPAAVKVQRPDLFLGGRVRAEPTAAGIAAQAAAAGQGAVQNG